MAQPYAMHPTKTIQLLNDSYSGGLYRSPKKEPEMIYVIMYLTAIVLANLSVVMFGPGVTILNAFLFIGLDLTARDRLHDAWHGRNLWLKMAGLIITGSALSWLLNKDAGQIAIASMVAFGAAAVVDAVVYHVLRDRARMVRMNGSNVPAALVDSLIFPTLAFGGFLPAIVIGQFAAKVLGGLVWSWLLTRQMPLLAIDNLHG